MDSKLLVVKALMLLYWDSHLNTPVDGTAELVNEIVNGIKLPDHTLSMDHSRETLLNLRGTIHNMIGDGQTFPHDKQALIQRLRINIKDDDDLYNAVTFGLEGNFTDEEIQSICKQHRGDLYKHRAKKNVSEALNKINAAIRFKDDDVDWSKFPDELIEKLVEFKNANTSGTRGPATVRGFVGEVDFQNGDSIKTALSQAMEETSLDGVLQTGMQGFNRLFGLNKGIRRGDTVVIEALSHCFKTGLMLKIFMGFAMYNKPFMYNLDKKPLLLFITLENSIAVNILSMYTTLMEAKTGRAVNPSEIDINTAYREVMDILSVNGYHFKMVRFDSGEFGYRQFVELCTLLESEGYEIHAAGVDYAGMMSKEGCTQGATGADMRDLYRRMRSYTNPRGIAFITPHQLNDGARELKRKHIPDFVKHVVGNGYLDSCRVLAQEVDIEIALDRVEVGGEAFLEMYIGKHRGVIKPTETKDKYCVLKFQHIGGIVDDIDGPDTSLRKVAGSNVSDMPDWDEPGGF